MSDRATRRLPIVVVCLILTLVAVAADGEFRQFSGFFEIADAIAEGDGYRVRLDFKIFNHGFEGVIDATLFLEDPRQPEPALGSIWVETLPASGSVRLSHEFILAGDVYDECLKGSAPNLRIEFLDSRGQPIERWVELSMLALAEEEAS